MKPFIPFLSLLFSLHWISGQGQTQSHDSFPKAMERMLWHDNIDKAQKQLLQKDGTVKISDDESVNLQATHAIVRQVDEMQQQIEEDSTLSGQGKIKYLRTLESMLQGYSDYQNKRDFP